MIKLIAVAAIGLMLAGCGIEFKEVKEFGHAHCQFVQFDFVRVTKTGTFNLYMMTGERISELPDNCVITFK